MIINEILASNNTVTRNPIGDYSDWIELYNTSEKPVNISNWYLTDTKSNLTKSKFPAGTTIPAHGYLIVFCDSSYTYPRIGGKYFANISLSKEGEYLGLIGADGTTIVFECDPSYP
ncbi:MAG: lamin tail domain-containing protein, partial [Verrucomicrobia bacterium]|nr:lamin tail domain-containing protein [Verrucomicrobiota bacterium]